MPLRTPIDAIVLGISDPGLPTRLTYLLLRHLPLRLRPLPLLIPPIMKRLVRRLFLHSLTLTQVSKDIHSHCNFLQLERPGGNGHYTVLLGFFKPGDSEL
jgi:hypothetical protein